MGGAAAGGAGGVTDGGAAGAAGGAAGGIDAGTHPTDGGCQGVDLSSNGVPAGTVVTASDFYTSTIYGPDGSVVDAGIAYGPDKAVDGDPTTHWIAPSGNAWIKLVFPAPVMIAAIRLHADALPVTNENYTVTTSTSTTPLGTATRMVTLEPGSVLPDIEITPGMYSDITLTVENTDSWVGIDEIFLLAAPACPGAG
jgi:hypothetical protein